MNADLGVFLREVLNMLQSRKAVTEAQFAHVQLPPPDTPKHVNLRNNKRQGFALFTFLSI